MCEKEIRKDERQKVYEEIMRRALYVGVGQATPAEIDEMNILQATKKAMREAAAQVSRSGGQVKYPDFETLAEMAANGFDNLVYKDFYPIFAGSTAPVKKLGWADMYSSMGITGVTMALTGEAAPRDVQPGDGVLSGCVNLTGVLRVRVEKRYAESTVAKILDLVAEFHAK